MIRTEISARGTSRDSHVSHTQRSARCPIDLTGNGRLLASVNEAGSNEPVVEGALCFDSDAYFFCKGGKIVLNHVVIQGTNACALVELYVEQTETPHSLEVEIKTTYRFVESERTA